MECLTALDRLKHTPEWALCSCLLSVAKYWLWIEPSPEKIEFKDIVLIKINDVPNMITTCLTKM